MRGGHQMWPALPPDGWQDTKATVHMWTQIVGKVQLAQSPLVNHWWNVTQFVTARGLSTPPMPYGSRTFQIEFDFLAHRLLIQTNDGASRTLALTARSVAEFYQELMEALGSLGLPVDIWTRPMEVEDPIPFERDHTHTSYVPEHASGLWGLMVQADRVLRTFRAGYLGKVSPVHFFWGAFDLAVTRFSGRVAPPHPGGVPNLADYVVREAYSHEVSSAGWWPGGGDVAGPAFYAYAYPEPEGFRDRPFLPEGAYYHPDLREFVLPYEIVRRAEQPDDVLLSFLQGTYEAAADLGGWDRASLERQGAAGAGSADLEGGA